MSNLSREIQTILATLKITPSQFSGQTKDTTHKCSKCGGLGYTFSVRENGNEYAAPCECRDLLIMQSKLEFANIPPEFEGYTVESFDLSLYQSPEVREKAKMAKRLCANYVRDFLQMKQEGKGLYLYSSTKGSGKTHMAAGIANDIIKKYRISVKFTSALQILGEIKNSWHQDTRDGDGEQRFIQDVIRVPVLVIDDIGVEKSTAWVDEKFYEILDGRMVNKQVTIFTSNCQMEALKLDERTVSRIIKMALPVPFPDESVRLKLAKAENRELYKMLLGG